MATLNRQNIIHSFQGEYRFLSNFWPSKVVLDDDTYPTVEHAYQAAKTLNLRERYRVNNCQTPGDAKRAGRYVTMRSDWDSIKLTIMENLLRQKFNDLKLASALYCTEDAELIEGNTWGDMFWGVCRGKGENHLGKLLMKIRADIAQFWDKYDHA